MLGKWAKNLLVRRASNSKKLLARPESCRPRASGPPNFSNADYSTHAVEAASHKHDNAAMEQAGAMNRPPSVAEELAQLNYRDLPDSDYDHITQSPRKEPVGANSTADAHTDALQEEDLSNKSPERVFKVVFVGDSGVGKSSFIHRFCSNTFKHTFSATIGVDFQVKNMKVDNHLIALQLWDTAGQERFRSITKQYFRKADGVIIMYDVTSETSFKNVRNWMISVQDGTEEGTVLAMVGNKVDLVEDESTRLITAKDGAKLADDYGALFYETSAQSGLFVRECMQGIASLLREKEDRELEKTLNVSEEEVKKKGCCD